MKFLNGQIYQADPLFEQHLTKELGRDSGEYAKVENVQNGGDFAPRHESCILYYRPDPQAQSPVFWQRNIWLKPFCFEFDSISEAAARLREVQRNWAAAPFCCFRRAALIAEKLPALSRKPKPFPWQLPPAPMGAWALLDQHTMIASAECTSPFPAGNIEFEQNRSDPPSRAYLKLWEALARCGSLPQPGERCFDAGASPGGWTWALSKLGAEITACDRAPLDDRLMALPNVRFIKHDAFTLQPSEIGALDWLVCDIACYPPRLFAWIEKWLSGGLCRNFICTIKMQGEGDFETPLQFAKIEGSQIVHLCHNKHELTWIKTESPKT
jgi:23S rRNA (cytidine2498-2'-O)-methyltransferase